MFDIAAVFTFSNILFTFLGTTVGVTFGAIPGVTTNMTIALFLPFTFGMEPVAAFGFLLGIYAGGQYGGAIPAILINTPGTPLASATMLDGYPMAQQGKAYEALSVSAISSFVGGIFSCVVLILLAPRLAQLALMFGPAEYFAVGVFGLSVVAGLSTDSFLKGFIAAGLGLLIATVGMDPITGAIRLTFGNRTLIGGINFIPALIGLFAIPEVISKLEVIFKKDKPIGNLVNITGKMVSLKTLRENSSHFIRSCIIGVIVGIAPGTGGSTSAWISYSQAKRASKNKELFGKGAIEGIIAPETANSALTGGCLVPMMTLGIPGDGITAVILGAFLIQGLPVGPDLFQNHPDVVTGIYVMLIMANIFMLIYGLAGIGVFAKILKIPTSILMPFVLVLCLIGSYATNASIFNMKVTFAIGLFAYFLTKAKFPMPPILIGIILGPIMESNFRRALIISHGNPAIFLRPISLVLLLISLFTFLYPVLSQYYSKYKSSKSV